MCIAVRMTENNVLDYGERLKTLRLILGPDSYKKILKLNNGKHPETVRKTDIIFHTQNSEETFERALSTDDDEINFAYIPTDLLPGPKDQNELTVFSLKKKDITEQGISIPETEDYSTITQVSWKEIIKYFEVVES